MGIGGCFHTRYHAMTRDTDLCAHTEIVQFPTPLQERENIKHANEYAHLNLAKVEGTHRRLDAIRTGRQAGKSSMKLQPLN